MTQFKKLTEWRTRGGWRAVIVKAEEHQLTVWHSVHPNTAFAHDNAGKYIMHVYNCPEPALEDLLEPWVEKRSGTVWVNVNEDGNFWIRSSREQADIAAAAHGVKRLACVEVKWTEGEGL